MARLEHLANELLYGIAEYLDAPDLNALLRTSKRLATLLTPTFRKISFRAENASAALYCAAAVGANRELVRLLLESGEDIAVFKDSISIYAPVHVSPSEASEDTVNFVLGRRAKLVLRHGPALHWAALKGRISLVKSLLNNGANVGDVDAGQAATALHRACEGTAHNNDEVISYLIDKGADMAATDIHGRPVLQWAVKTGNSSATESLIKHKVDINCHNKKDGATALHTASALRDGTIVRILLENGADVNSTDNRGMTPLHIAAARGHEAAVRLLLENGADINAQDGRHSSPLHLAAQGWSR